VLAYADVVLAESKSWLSTLHDADLDRVPDNRGHLARHPAYRTAAYLTEVENMWKHTLADVISIDIGHARGHLGEARLVAELAGRAFARG
jgi:hypothetical protein